VNPGMEDVAGPAHGRIESRGGPMPVRSMRIRPLAYPDRHRAGPLPGLPVPGIFPTPGLPGPRATPGATGPSPCRAGVFLAEALLSSFFAIPE
jgi:hypothetical protein